MTAPGTEEVGTMRVREQAATEWPAPAGEPWAAVHETHAAAVVLLGGSAYKVKKPVDLGFLDFRTLEQRRRACEREVELNARLAPDVYVGVADVVGPDREVRDHAVVMRRLPQRRSLATLVDSGADCAGEVREVARAMAVFHASGAPHVDEPDTVTSRSLTALWRSSLLPMRAYAGTVVPEDVLRDVEHLVGRYLEGRHDLFERRRLTGAVVDGHGDLQCADIFCLPDGPRILDCLEFDDRLRVVDQVDDVCFLAMDLEQRGRPDLAQVLLTRYLELSGDSCPESLVEHYLAYRAYVRTKVAAVRHDQGDPGAAPDARRYALLSLAHLEQGAVRLVVVGGPPGTGKSSVAAGLADRCGMTVLSSDRIRKELAGLPPLDPVAAGLGEGLYSGTWTRRVHEELARRASMLLRLGESVVLDATFGQAWQREAARRTARACAADLVELRCDVPADVAARRIGLRGRAESRSGTVSDARPAVATALRATFAPWSTATTLDTSPTPGEVLQAAVALVRPADRRLHPRSRIEPD